MFRLVLAVAMILQVTTCSMNCALAESTIANDSSAQRGCSCCHHESSESQSTPSPESEDGQCGTCFCNSAANTSVTCEVILHSDAQPIWAALELSPLVALTAKTSNFEHAPRLPGNGSGVAMRLAVNSLQL